MLKRYFLYLITALALAAFSWTIFSEPGGALKPIQELRVRITGSTQVPEPTNIQSTGDWYYLDHVSSGLVSFDSSKKTFEPLFAKSWSSGADNTHIFKLKDGIKFHDGSPITAQDIVWSIKRHLKFKTSTHFPLWEYLVGCENLKSLNDECEGLKITPAGDIAFRLKAQTDSFYLQVASPETGIWAASDMDSETGALTPTKFSGAYFVEKIDPDFALLKRNEFSPVSQKFPNSPKTIRSMRIPLANLESAVLKNEVDVVIKTHSPSGERNWAKDNIAVHSTTPSTIVYFFGLGSNERPVVGQDLVQALWKSNKDKSVTSSESFLPFSNKAGLSKEEFLNELSPTTAKTLRVLIPVGFFSKSFLKQVQDAAQLSHSEIIFSEVSGAEFMAAFADPKAQEKNDYIMSAYAASERYPAVQLRYLTKSLAKPPIDLKKAESPDFSGDQLSVFRSYEKWLLNSRQAIPLFFTVTLFVHRPEFDIGEQSTSDAEIELWRIVERTK